MLFSWSEMEQFQCSICSKTYSYKEAFEKHIKSCSDNREYKCDKCDKEFISFIKFRSHQTVHKAICCKDCGLQIPVNSSTSHKIKCSVNQEVNILYCHQCDYKTTKNANLKCHIESHARKQEREEKP